MKITSFQIIKIVLYDLALALAALFVFILFLSKKVIYFRHLMDLIREYRGTSNYRGEELGVETMKYFLFGAISNYIYFYTVNQFCET